MKTIFYKWLVLSLSCHRLRRFEKSNPPMRRLEFTRGINIPKQSLQPLLMTLAFVNSNWEIVRILVKLSNYV